MRNQVHMFMLKSGQIRHYVIERPLVDMEAFFMPGGSMDECVCFYVLSDVDTYHVSTDNHNGLFYASRAVQGGVERGLVKGLYNGHMESMDLLKAYLPSMKASDESNELWKKAVNEDTEIIKELISDEFLTSVGQWVEDPDKPDPFEGQYNDHSQCAGGPLDREQLLDLASHKMLTELTTIYILKDQMRYLGRKLTKLEDDYTRRESKRQRAQLKFGYCSDDNLANLIHLYGNDQNVIGFAIALQTAANERFKWLCDRIDELS